jgi:hypothetical protein
MEIFSKRDLNLVPLEQIFFETKMLYYNESISLFLGKTFFVIITLKFEWHHLTVWTLLLYKVVLQKRILLIKLKLFGFITSSDHVISVKNLRTERLMLLAARTPNGLGFSLSLTYCLYGCSVVDALFRSHENIRGYCTVNFIGLPYWSS